MLVSQPILGIMVYVAEDIPIVWLGGFTRVTRLMLGVCLSLLIRMAVYTTSSHLSIYYVVPCRTNGSYTVGILCVLPCSLLWSNSLCSQLLGLSAGGSEHVAELWLYISGCVYCIVKWLPAWSVSSHL